MKSNAYADWVRGEVMNLSPTQATTGWMSNWSRALEGLLSASAIFEAVSLVISRWEFLGSLYRGNDGKTGVDDVRAYTKRFLEPIQGRYRDIHDLARDDKGNSDFYSILRD